MKPSHLLISVDLKGAEWMVTSYLANEPRRIQIHRDGGDPHSTTANFMSGVPIPLIQQEDQLFGKENDPAKLKARRQNELPDLLKATWLPTLVTLRQGGKKANFGLDYGMEYKRYALENLTPEAEAKTIVRLYRQKAYPGLVKHFYPSIQQELYGGEVCADCNVFRYAYCRDGKTIWTPGDVRNKPQRPEQCAVCGSSRTKLSVTRVLQNCFGRKIKLLGGWGPELYQQGYAFKSQSTVADCTAKAMCTLYEADKSYNRRAQITAWYKAEVPWMTTHDDLTIQYPLEPDFTDLAATIWDIGYNLMRPVLRYPPHEFQLDTDVKVGFQYGDPTKDRPKDGLHGLKLTRDSGVEDVKVRLQSIYEQLK